MRPALHLFAPKAPVGKGGCFPPHHSFHSIPWTFAVTGARGRDQLEMVPVLKNHNFAREQAHKMNLVVEPSQKVAFHPIRPVHHPVLHLSNDSPSQSWDSLQTPIMISLCNALGFTWRLQNDGLTVTTKPPMIGPRWVLFVYFSFKPTF